MISTQEQYEYLIGLYDFEKYFPPRPVRTLEEICNAIDGFGKAYQEAFDRFFYSDLIYDAVELRDQGIEYVKEFYEGLLNLGVYIIAFTKDDPILGSHMSLLYWTGAFYEEVGRF